MKMDAMVEYLEKRGFEVKKYYNSRAHVYNFKISKNGHTLSNDFEYPATANGPAVDRIQRDFLENMIKEFNRTYNNKESIRHASSNGIDWFVESAEFCSEHDEAYYNIELQARVTGDVKTDHKTMLEYLMAKLSDSNPMQIKEVIFNPPATIVYWQDGTKTVVKCQEDDVYDSEKGLAMAITKRALGNQGNYYNEMQKWLSKYDEPESLYPKFVLDNFNLRGAANAFSEYLDKYFNAKRGRNDSDESK